MAKIKESKDNPWHKDYGVLRNTIYILRKEKQYSPNATGFKVLGIVCGSILSYFWGVFGKYVIDIIQSGNSREECIQALLKLIILAGSTAALLNIGNTTADNKTWYLFVKIRMNMILERIDKALCMNYQLLEQPEVLDIHQRATSATGGNNNGVEGMMRLMSTLGKNLFTVIVTALAVVVLDWRLIFALIIIAIVQYLYFMRIIKLDKINYWNVLAPVNREVNYMGRVSQDFDYAKDIRLFHMKDFLLAKQKGIYAKQEKLNDYHFEIWFWHALVGNLLYIVGRFLVYAALFVAVLKNGMSIGNFTMFLALAISFSENLLSFLHRFGDYQRASMEVDDFRSFLEIREEEKEYIPIPQAQKYEIEFHDVSYRYVGATTDAVNHLSVKLHPGEKLAVVGLNGAGKTTFIKLLCRLYDPTEGTILLDGVDIKEYDYSDYMSRFAPVFQDFKLFCVSLKENITLQENTDTDITNLLEMVELDEFAGKLKKGTDTCIYKFFDEEGVEPSGGEQQKMAIARALFKKSPIVILDEPTAALDPIAEYEIYRQFHTLVGGKTAFYISHRLSSCKFCDKIAVFSEGKIAEYGSHEELAVIPNGIYAEMFEAQAQYYR